MNVVQFPTSSITDIDRGWHHIELQQLIALYSAQAHAGNAESWDTDSTDRADPQFYLLGPGPDHECVACISRVGRIYVLENGHGSVMGEDRNLTGILARAAQMLPRKKGASFVTRMILMMCAIRVVIDEKLEPLIPDSTELLVRVVPPLAAII